MARGQADRTFELSRRDFLVTTGAALAGVAAFSASDRKAAGTRHPQRGGTLQYGSHTDMAGLDAHRHNANHQITPWPRCTMA